MVRKCGRGAARRGLRVTCARVERRRACRRPRSAVAVVASERARGCIRRMRINGRRVERMADA